MRISTAARSLVGITLTAAALVTACTADPASSCVSPVTTSAVQGSASAAPSSSSGLRYGIDDCLVTPVYNRYGEVTPCINGLIIFAVGEDGQVTQENVQGVLVDGWKLTVTKTNEGNFRATYDAPKLSIHHVHTLWLKDGVWEVVETQKTGNLNDHGFKGGEVTKVAFTWANVNARADMPQFPFPIDILKLSI